MIENSCLVRVFVSKRRLNQFLEPYMAPRSWWYIYGLLRLKTYNQKKKNIFYEVSKIYKKENNISIMSLIWFVFAFDWRLVFKVSWHDI